MDGILHFKGKNVNLKYIPVAEKWKCLQCEAANVLSKERCWQCSALRAGSDHLLPRESRKDRKTSPHLSSTRSRKRKASSSPSRRSPSRRSPSRRRTSRHSRERSPDRGAKKSAPRPSLTPRRNRDPRSINTQSSTAIIWGIGSDATKERVVKLLAPHIDIKLSSVRLVKNHKNDRRGFGFIDLKSHKEAVRLTTLARELKPPLTLNGKLVTIDIAVGKRKDDRGNYIDRTISQLKKKRKPRRAKKGKFRNVGSNALVDDGASFVYDSKTGRYVDPLTNTYYESKTQQRKKGDHPPRDPGNEGKPQARQPRRGFTEEMEEGGDDGDAFKRPLPPPVMKKEEPPPEPQVNPLLKLIGEYEDSDEEVEQIFPSLQRKPPVKKKSSPASAPKQAPKAVPKPVPKPLPKAVPKAAPTIVISMEDEKMTDWKKLVCLLCRRQFSCKQVLLRHQHFSDLHKKNVALHEKMMSSQKGLVYLQQE